MVAPSPITRPSRPPRCTATTSKKIYDLRITDGVAQDERIGDGNMLGRRVYVTGEMGANVVIEVEDLRHTIYARSAAWEAYNVMRGWGPGGEPALRGCASGEAAHENGLLRLYEKSRSISG